MYGRNGCPPIFIPDVNQLRPLEFETGLSQLHDSCLHNCAVVKERVEEVDIPSKQRFFKLPFGEEKIGVLFLLSHPGLVRHGCPMTAIMLAFHLGWLPLAIPLKYSEAIVEEAIPQLHVNLGGK